MRHLKRYLAALWAFSCLSTLALASEGGTSSGGGELIKDKDNPWFLWNTPVVPYCVVLNETHFHQTRERVEAIIEKAISYWRSEFKRAFIPTYRGLTPLGIATQNFQRTECDPSVLLRFQLGHLDPTQAKHLNNRRDFVAATARENYDRENMRGSGFIYVAPDSGPWKPNMENMRERPWQDYNGNLLYLVLIHELGHVFGLPHMGGRFDITGAAYPEWVVTNQDAWPIQNAPYFFGYDMEGGRRFVRAYCIGDADSRFPESVWEFLGSSTAYNCLSLVTHKNTVEIYGGEKTYHPNENNVLLGKVTMEEKQRLTHYGAFVSHVFLPSTQKVFTHVPSDLGRYLPGAAQTGGDYPGLYQSQDGRVSRQVFVTINPQGRGVVIRGQLGQRLLLDVLQGL